MSSYKVNKTELQNSALYDEIAYYGTFLKYCHVGDIIVKSDVKFIITDIDGDIISMTHICDRKTDEDEVDPYYDYNAESGQLMKFKLDFAYYSGNGLPIYKYIGPMANNIQQTQANINHLHNYLVETDFREGQEKFREGQTQEKDSL